MGADPVSDYLTPEQEQAEEDAAVSAAEHADTEHRDSAAARVREWVRQWTLPNRNRSDLVYSIHFDPEATDAELYASDLILLVDENDRLRAALTHCTRAPF